MRVDDQVWPSAISVPHDGVGGCTPAPRNESAASVTMLFAMISVKKTSSELAMFGSSSLNMTRSGLAPCDDRRLDELLLAQRQDLAAQRTPDVRDQHVRDDERRDPEAAALDVDARSDGSR